MERSRSALIAVIAAQWLAIIGGALMVWWLLPSGHLGHLAAGAVGLALAGRAVALALSLAGIPAKPLWGLRPSGD